MSVARRLADLGLELPEIPAPAAAYVPARLTGDLVFTAGQLPVVAGELLATGRCGAEIDVERAQELARVAALNLLAAAAGQAELDQLELVKLTVFVASTEDFVDQHLVANGASLLLAEVLGDDGIHARSAVGVSSLPMNSPVEVEAVFAIAR